MFRDRTNLYLSYRRTFPHNVRLSSTYRDDSDKATTEFDIDNEAYPMIEMGVHSKGKNTLPPVFIDIARDIDDYLDKVREHTAKLHKLYQKNSLPGFEDKTHDEKLIEDISFKVIQLFQKCYNIMKKLKGIYDDQTVDGRRLNRGELMILDNVQKSYADKIQIESNKFRALQNNYLKFLNKDDLKPISNNTLKCSSANETALLEEDTIGGIGAREQQEIEEYSRQTLQRRQATSSDNYLHVRDEEITQLAQGVLEVSTIFREMQSLIIDQGTIIDRIDYNLENTVIELKSAQNELNKATTYQKRTQKCKIILLLTLCVIALIFFILLKPRGGSTRVVHEVEQVPVPVHPEINDFENDKRYIEDNIQLI
ncbi:t-SNARE coiled-coil homology domain profile [Nakaseomyces glabratus]